MLTEAEKAKRNEHRQQTKAAKRERYAQKKAEGELIRKNLLQVLESEEATPAERLESSKLLLELDKRYY